MGSEDRVVSGQWPEAIGFHQGSSNWMGENFKTKLKKSPPTNSIRGFVGHALTRLRSPICPAGGWHVTAILHVGKRRAGQ